MKLSKLDYYLLEYVMPILIGLGFVAIVALWLGGCSAYRPGPAMEEDAVLTASTPIADANIEIAADATAIQSEARSEMADLTLIDGRAGNILFLTTVIQTQVDTLKQVNQQVNDLVDSNAKAEQEIARLQKKLDDAQRKFLLWLYGIGAFVLAGGIILAIFLNWKVGAMVAILGVVLLTVAHLLLYYAVWVYLGGGVIILGAAAYAAYRYFKLDRKVLPQVMATVSALKPTVDGREFDQFADQTQDTDVQNEVNRRRKQSRLAALKAEIRKLKAEPI